MQVLKKSRRMQDALDSQVKKLEDFVLEEKTAIKQDVMQMNQKDTDKIMSPSHDIVGPRSSPISRPCARASAERRQRRGILTASRLR